jgi:hypothetical protein
MRWKLRMEIQLTPIVNDPGEWYDVTLKMISDATCKTVLGPQ